jgi:hypothetical protein
MPAQLAADNTTVQNISRATKKAKQKSIAAELASLSDKFSAIAGEVQEKVTLEHETQEDRLQSVEDHISRIQNALAIEQHRRVATLDKVKNNLNDLCGKVAGECTAQLEAVRPDIPDRIGAWHGRLDTCFRMLAEEKVARQRVIDRERIKLLKTVDDFEKQLEIEKVERLERETILMQKVTSEVQELQTDFDGERARREVRRRRLSARGRRPPPPAAARFSARRYCCAPHAAAEEAPRSWMGALCARWCWGTSATRTTRST